MADAWNFAGPKRQGSQPGGSPFQNAANAQQRRPPPPVPPRENASQPPRPPDLPRRDDPRQANSAYRASPSEQTAYQHFNPPTSAPQQRPNVQRSNTSAAQTPRRSGFNPNAPGSDERPTSGPSNYNTHFRDPSDAPTQTAFSPTNLYPPRQAGFGRSRPPSIDTRAPQPHQRGPSGSGGLSPGDPPPMNGAQMKRSQSVRDATKLGDPPRSPRAHHHRHRSASPTKFGANGRPKNQPFGPGGSSNTTSSSSPSPPSSDTDNRLNQQNVPPRARPLKKPTPPSSRMNGGQQAGNPQPDPSIPPGYRSRRGSRAGPSRKNSGAAQAGQPASNMYEPFFPLDIDGDPSFSYNAEDQEAQHWSDCHPLGPEKPAPAARRRSFPRWAIPTSVFVANAGKQDVPQDDFQQSTWEYVEDPLLVDLDDAGVAGVKCHPCCTTHCIASSVFQHAKDMELLAEQDPRFPAFTFDKTDQSKSRSAEEINTSFSPNDFTGTFTGSPGVQQTSPATSRRGSPPKRGRETLSARPSRNHIDQRQSTDQTRATLSPTSAPGVRFFGEVPPSQQTSASSDARFTPDQWTNHDFFTQSPMSAGPSTRQSQGGVARGPTVPQAAYPADAKDAQEERDTGSQHDQSSTSADAMDIDPAPPGQQTEKPPRQYAQPPSAWRQSQHAAQATSNTGRRRSSVRSNHDHSAHASGSEMPSLNNLGATLNGTTSHAGGGLNDMSNLNANIPFTSKPSSTHPTKLFGETTPITHPPVPVPPLAPQTFTRTSWRDFTAKTFAYITAMNQLHRQIAAKQAEFAAAEEALLKNGPQGLLAAGESSGDVGVEAYLRRCREAESWAEFGANVAGRLKVVMEEYVRMKGRVRERAESGRLAD